ncbi:MAG TPA: acyl-protein synthetase, partial [Candidatus Limnocylindria bacterium]|nr:acyl-protein synthetase [Candidatus Limnocylindria bacterium]
GKRLGIVAQNVVSEYGMSELSSQAYETRDAAGTPSGYQFPPWVRIRLVSPESGREVPDGQPGLLQILDLANVWSVAAVQTGDLAIKSEGSFKLLGRAPKSEVRGCSLMTA